MSPISLRSRHVRRSESLIRVFVILLLIGCSSQKEHAPSNDVLAVANESQVRTWMDQTEISDRPIKASLLMARMLAIDSTCSQRRRVVEVLIEYHPDLKFVDNAGNALLILAISSNCMQLVDELLVAGLNPNVGNVQSGVTPLAFSCEYGHYDAIPVLLKHGAKTDVADSLGRFPGSCPFCAA